MCAVAEYAGAWPSRDYIYNGARKDLKEGAFPLFRESQVVIDVHDLADDAQVVKAVEWETARAREWIAEKAPEEAESRPRNLGEVEAADKFSGTRSIFDDVDA